MDTGVEGVPAGKLRSVVTHLAMEAPPPEEPPPPPSGVAIARRQAMPAVDYLRLYHAIGDDWLWWSRLTWDEAKLTAHLAGGRDGDSMWWRPAARRSASSS